MPFPCFVVYCAVEFCVGEDFGVDVLEGHLVALRACVCACVYEIYTFVYVCVYVCMCIYAYSVSWCVVLYRSAWVRTLGLMSLRVTWSPCVCVCVCVVAGAYTYICMYICIYT